MRSVSPHPRTDGLVHISLLQHYHQTHLAGTNILKDIPSRGGNCAQFYVNIVILGRPALLFVSHYSKHNIEKGWSQYF